MRKNVAEREINFWDMLWAICLKWRNIFACAIILSVLAGGFSYYKNAKAIAEINEMAEVDIDEIAQRLDDEELETMDTYITYKDMYSKQVDFNEKSELMKLDAESFYKGEVTYYIDNNYEVVYPVINKTNPIVSIVNAYRAEFNKSDFIKKSSDILDIEYKGAAYNADFIDFDNTYEMANSIETDASKGILSVSVYVSDEYECEKMLALIKEIVESKKDEIASTHGKHDLVLIQDTCVKSANNTILGTQKENIDKVQTYAKLMSDMEAKFSNDERLYINAYKQMNMKTEEKEPVRAGISKKLLILGFLGGVFLALFYFALVYIFGTKIRLEDDFEDIFGSKLLGNVLMSEKKKKWFGFIDKLFEKLRHFNQRYFETEDALDMVAANIRIAMQKVENKKVMVTGAVCGEDEKKVADALAERLKKDGIEIVCESPMLYNAESLEKLVEIGSVVLVEKAEKSFYQEVAREIEICAQQDVSLIGTVVVY